MGMTDPSLPDRLSSDGKVADWPLRTFLEAAYRTILKREPDPDGLTNFVRDADTIGREQIIAILMQSDEFRELFLSDPDVATWVGGQIQILSGGMDARTGRCFEVPPIQVPVGGDRFLIYDYPGAPTARLVARELHRDAYRLEGLELPPNPVVVDVGAHIGLFSLKARALWPTARIFAFEPVPATFALLSANLETNGAHVAAFNLAVSGPGQETMTLQLDPWGNSGAASSQYASVLPFHAQVEVRTTSLPVFLDKQGIGRVDLLKLDCEGAEYDILNDLPDLSERVGHLRVEIHQSGRLLENGFTPAGLVERLERELGRDRLHVVHADKRPEEAAAHRAMFVQARPESIRK